jgi:hypothetical protein
MWVLAHKEIPQLFVEITKPKEWQYVESVAEATKWATMDAAINARYNNCKLNWIVPKEYL